MPRKTNLTRKRRSNPFGSEDLRLEPGEVVHADLVLLSRDGDEDVLTFKDVHLYEFAP